MNNNLFLCRKFAAFLSTLLFVLTNFTNINAAEVIVGGSTQNSCNVVFGGNSNYKYSATKALYTAEEVGGSCVITDIAFNIFANSTSNGRYNTNLKIYMGEYDGNQFSGPLFLRLVS